MGFTNIALKDGKDFVESLNIRNIDINNLSNAQKGDIRKRTAQVVARSQELSCYFCDGKTNANGVDNIFRDSQGNFIIEGSKFVFGAGNAGLSRLSTSTGHRQLTNEYLFGLNPSSNSGALGRTSGLSTSQRMENFTAFQNGQGRTRLTVVKDRHSGSSITQALTRDSQLGVGAPSQISEVVIVEIPLK